MEPLAIFTYLDSTTLEPLNAFIDTGVNGLSAYISAPLRVGITIYIVLNGIAFVRGLTNETMMQFAINCIKLAIIFTLATRAGDFNYYVKSVFFDYLPTEISNALAGNPNAGVSANALDTLLKKGLDTGSAMWEQSELGFRMILSALFFLLIVVASFMMCVFGYVVLFYAKCALTIIIALGPLFIALALFQPTRRFTEAWIGQAANFIILQVLVITIGSLLVNAASSIALSTSSPVGAIVAVIQFSVIAICAWYIFMQLPSIASGLAAGGANLAFGGHVYPSSPFRAAYNAMRGSKSAQPPTTAPNASSRSDHTPQNNSPAGGNSPSQTTAPAPERPPAPVTRPTS